MPRLAAAGQRLEHHRAAVAERGEELRVGLARGEVPPREPGKVGMSSGRESASRRRLVAEQGEGLRGGPRRTSIRRRLAGLGERGVLAQEPIARMDRRRSRWPAATADDLVDVEVGLASTALQRHTRPRRPAGCAGRVRTNLGGHGHRVRSPSRRLCGRCGLRSRRGWRSAASSTRVSPENYITRLIRQLASRRKASPVRRPERVRVSPTSPRGRSAPWEGGYHCSIPLPVTLARGGARERVGRPDAVRGPDG